MGGLRTQDCRKVWLLFSQLVQLQLLHTVTKVQASCLFTFHSNYTWVVTWKRLRFFIVAVVVVDKREKRFKQVYPPSKTNRLLYPSGVGCPNIIILSWHFSATHLQTKMVWHEVWLPLYSIHFESAKFNRPSTALKSLYTVYWSALCKNCHTMASLTFTFR